MSCGLRISMEGAHTVTTSQYVAIITLTIVLSMSQWRLAFPRGSDTRHLINNRNSRTEKQEHLVCVVLLPK